MTAPAVSASRVRGLLDDDGLEPLSPPGDSGQFAAMGRIDGSPVVAFASEPSVKGGAMGERVCDVILHAYGRALAARCPIIGLWHSGGAWLTEGVRSLHGVGRVFAAMTEASGKVPQISVVLGPAAGAAAYGPALTDIVIAAPEGRIFVTGPDVVRSVTGEDVDALELGGVEMHARRSGVVHILTADAPEACRAARQAATLLGRQGSLNIASVQPRNLAGLLPESARRAYDIRPLVSQVLDEPGLELQARWARNIVTSLGRLGGRTVGVIANNPLRVAGCLDSMTAEKAARFVRMCDAFGVPLIVLVDVPGYLPGRTQEMEGVVRRGAKLLHAFAEAVVPRVTVLIRKSYGGAYIAMNSRALGATKVYAWPGAEIAVMNAASAVQILHRRHLASIPPEQRAEAERVLIADHEGTVGGLSAALALGVVDEVITPQLTRLKIAQAIAEAPERRGLHTNIPL